MHVDFVTGVPGGMPGTPAALLAGVAMLPPEVTSWSATGIGRSHLPIAAMALWLGLLMARTPSIGLATVLGIVKQSGGEVQL